MTQDQIMAMIRQAIPIIGTLLTTLGFATADQVATWTNVAMQVLGPLMTVAGIVWAFVANSKKSIIKSASAMQEVDSKKLGEAIGDPELKQAAKEAATPAKT